MEQSVKNLIREENRGSYDVVTLIEHWNINTQELSREEFIKLMRADLQKAQEMYSELVRPENEAYIQRAYDNALRSATKFAESKWKTEARRQQYIDEQMAKFREKDFAWLFREIFWDFQPHTGNSIPGVCVLQVSDPDFKLGRCYDEWLTSKWWTKGFGWRFSYRCHSSKGSYSSNERPYIELMMDEETTKQRNKEQQSIDDAILAYYASKRPGEYCGD